MSEIMKFRDVFLCGFDTSYKSPDIILKAYNDDSGVTERFILNILNHINTRYNLNLDTSAFDYYPKWNDDMKRVEMSLICNRTIKVTDNKESIIINEGDNIHIEYSHKFDSDLIESLAFKSNLISRKVFITDDKYFMMAIFVKGLGKLWTVTDHIFRNIIGFKNLRMKPIELRNPIIFYLGHIYVFYDIKVNGLNQNDIYYQTFERGRDPLVNEPEKCHRSSEVLESYDYPNHEDIIKNNENIKSKILQFIKTNGLTFDLLTSIEHEIMHIETTMYISRMMNIEFPIKIYYSNNNKKIITIPERKIMQGSSETFVWDNEKPAHNIIVKSFKVDNLPITWSDLLAFLEDNTNIWEKLINFNTNKQMRITESQWLDYNDCKNFPAWINLETAQSYIRWMNNRGIKCRLMTEDEFDSLASTLHKTNLGNVNFKNYHAVPIGYYNDYSDDGVGELFGNGWELTSTLFSGFEGFIPQSNYSEYSQDFFTDVHYVLKGASPFTSDDIIRKSFRNWYQHNYLYHPAKFRLVYDNLL
jgi:formylglycine-generating enzyme required for sulfatase activity